MLQLASSMTITYFNPLVGINFLQQRTIIMIGKLAVDVCAAPYTVKRDLGEWAPVKSL